MNLHCLFFFVYRTCCVYKNFCCQGFEIILSPLTFIKSSLRFNYFIYQSKSIELFSIKILINRTAGNVKWQICKMQSLKGKWIMRRSCEQSRLRGRTVKPINNEGLYSTSISLWLFVRRWNWKQSFVEPWQVPFWHLCPVILCYRITCLDDEGRGEIAPLLIRGNLKSSNHSSIKPIIQSKQLIDFIKIILSV